MAQRPDEIRAELGRARAFLETFIEALVDWEELDSASLDHMRHGLDAAERQGGAIALRGAKMAVNDMLAMARDLSMAQVEALDQRLVAANAPRLSELLREKSGTISKLIARDRIKSDVEYYLLKEEVADESAPLSPAQREQAVRMLQEFEGKHS